MFIVRDGRLAAICEPRELEHCMSVPTCIDDGQTLLGGAQSQFGHCYLCLLDVERGEQRSLIVDSLGRLVENAKTNFNWVRSSEQLERAMFDGRIFVQRRRRLAWRSLLHREKIL